ncbi:MAG: S8 family peptidase [Gordonibacter sp.]|nr:S8 family peptidase [Gordonibacter sp.]
MNEILQLKGSLQQKSNPSTPGPPELPTNKVVSAGDLDKLKSDLEHVSKFWHEDRFLESTLVSVHYKQVVAKSNRIGRLLSGEGKRPNETIVGAKFAVGKTRKHIITHRVSHNVVSETIGLLEKCIVVLNTEFQGAIDSKTLKRLNDKNDNGVVLRSPDVKKTTFAGVVRDAHFVEGFHIPQPDQETIEAEAIITLFDMDTDTTALMRKLGIRDFSEFRTLDDTTLYLRHDQYLQLMDKAPYLVAMAVSDLSELSGKDFPFSSVEPRSIPAPQNEPTIGVIDTPFDERAYFSDWVDYDEKYLDGIEISDEDRIHGTEISSIIVDGPSLNPLLDDGCGRFKVRHFGVSTKRGFSSFSIVRAIKDIIQSNQDIKVWNLSLGSKKEAPLNFVSPEAAILDRIQHDHDVIFIIAGTNLDEEKGGVQRIGSPADSLNALVVNSVGFDNEPASYTRRGPVLSFFGKPDICYYGGDASQKIITYAPDGKGLAFGTSCAAPWVARKMAYLIHIVGLTRETAKALLIDSATGWGKIDDSYSKGYGVIPISIDDILKTPEDEIRFFISGVSKAYDTYSYNIPIPIVNEKQPFLAKATLCYFPICTRNQGVDYTNTEIDIHFGRIKSTEKNQKPQINPINENLQGEEGFQRITEEEARDNYRKWDNVKHISDIEKSRMVPKKIQSNTGLWGLSLKTKNRLYREDGVDLPFGIVITLKEMNGINRIDEFVQQCLLRGWLVNRIDIEASISIYEKAEEEVRFDE